MGERNAGLIADPLFVGATRPPMRWGVTYAALLANLVITMEAFLVTRNLLTLLLAIYLFLRPAEPPRNGRRFEMPKRLRSLHSGLQRKNTATRCRTSKRCWRPPAIS